MKVLGAFLAGCLVGAFIYSKVKFNVPSSDTPSKESVGGKTNRPGFTPTSE